MTMNEEILFTISFYLMLTFFIQSFIYSIYMGSTTDISAWITAFNFTLTVTHIWLRNVTDPFPGVVLLLEKIRTGVIIMKCTESWKVLDLSYKVYDTVITRVFTF